MIPSTFWLKVGLFFVGLLIVAGIVFKIYNVGRLTERAVAMEASLREAQRARRIRSVAGNDPDAWLLPRGPADH